MSLGMRPMTDAEAATVARTSFPRPASSSLDSGANLPGAKSSPPPAFSSDAQLAAAHGATWGAPITIAEIRKADDMPLAPIPAKDALHDALTHLGAVVHYGLPRITDRIDRDHIVTAHAILSQLVKAQNAAPAMVVAQ